VFRFCIENSIEEKVIEKAYKKLRLDALVIQQGRLTENQGSKVRQQHGRLSQRVRETYVIFKLSMLC
jgi:SNF2 family DNA or RNA helicase